jgi:hypothetical protein
MEEQLVRLREDSASRVDFFDYTVKTEFAGNTLRLSKD